MIDPYVDGAPYITFFPFLAVATLLGGVWGGASALVLDAIASVFMWPTRESGVISLIAFVVSGAIVIGTVYLLNEVVAALRRSETRAAMIAREMQHRVKNVLQLVQSISTMTVRNTTSAKEHEVKLNSRILALSRAMEAPSAAATNHPVELSALLERILKPFGQSRFTVGGPPVRMTDDMGSMLGLAIYELATNASKYGALSAPAGTVCIRWQLRDAGFAELEWEEGAAPRLRSPVRLGSARSSLAPHSRQIEEARP